MRPRTLTIAIVITMGCASDASPQKASPAPPSKEPPMIIVKQLEPQTSGPGLLLAGSTLVRPHAGAIELWDLTSGKRTSSIAHDGTGALGTRDGAPIAVVRNAKGPRLIELGTGKEIPAEYASSFNGVERIHATGDTLFVGQRSRLELYRIKDKVELAKVISWKRDELKSFTGMGDGVYFFDGAFVRVGRDGTTTRYDSSLSSPLHVAPGPRPDTLWTTTSDELQLVTLADGKATVTTRVTLPGVYHLAAAGDAAAVLTIEMTAGRYSKLTVTVVEADGRVRWTKSVPPPTWTSGWIAGSKNAVAISFGDELHAWSAKDGRALLP